MSEEKLLYTTESTVYKLYTVRRKNAILVACSLIGFLSPFTDTIYLPALSGVADDLHGSDAAVAATVSAYLGAVGLGQLFWGPLSDHYGRLKVMYACLLLFIIVTVGCAFAVSMTMLILLRTIEGFLVGSTVVSAQAVIADVFEEHERGQAMGAFLTPMLVGPIIAPVIGGYLSQALGWRSTFIFLAAITTPIAVYAYVVLPETHQWFVVQAIKRRNEDLNSKNLSSPIGNSHGTASATFATTHGLVEHHNLRSTSASSVSSAAPNRPSDPLRVDLIPRSSSTARKVSINSTTLVLLTNTDSIIRPPWILPWEALVFMFDAQLAPSYFLSFTTFGVMFTSLTTLPLYLNSSPYSLSTSTIGLCYLPIGVGMLLGAQIGGYYSDRSALAFPAAPEGRLLYGIPSMWMVPLGCVAFGFTLDRGVHVGVVLTMQALLGYGQALLMPSVLGYLSAARPQNSAAVGSIMFFLCFTGAAISISVSVTASDLIGMQYFFLILGLLSGVACLWSTIDIVWRSCYGGYSPVKQEIV